MPDGTAFGDEIELLTAFSKLDDLEEQDLLLNLYPDETYEWRGRMLWARRLYPKHLMFFEAGRHYGERLASGGNRIGKTFGLGGYETALHLTGLYPDWWPGRRWDRPVSWWAAGKNFETTRDIVQKALFGGTAGSGQSKRLRGTGLIPRRLIESVTWRPGVNDLADVVMIRHASGGLSELGLKSYHQGRGAFEGTSRDGVWFDEEPDEATYSEAATRTIDSKGTIFTTFTPLEGVSGMVKRFMGDDCDTTL